MDLKIINQPPRPGAGEKFKKMKKVKYDTVAGVPVVVPAAIQVAWGGTHGHPVMLAQKIVAYSKETPAGPGCSVEAITTDGEPAYIVG